MRDHPPRILGHQPPPPRLPGGEVVPTPPRQPETPGVAVDLVPKILAFATKGAGTNEEDRLRALLSKHNVEWFGFARREKFRSFKQLIAKLKPRQYDLAVMEGTGLAGGL